MNDSSSQDMRDISRDGREQLSSESAVLSVTFQSEIVGEVELISISSGRGVDERSRIEREDEHNLRTSVPCLST